MFWPQIPASPILVGAQPVPSHQMTTHDMALPAALQTDDVLALNGSPDRHGRRPLDDGFYNRLAQIGERLMDRRNQGAELLGHDLIASDIRGHDFRREVSIGRCGRLLVGHLLSPPHSDRQLTMPGQF
jgi:hypothetical protein